MVDYEMYEEGDSIYSQDFREQLVEDDEMSPYEQAFMKGWEEAI